MEEDKKSWTDKKEEQIKQWKKVCFCYNHLHEKEKILLKKKTKFLLILSLLLSSSVAIISSVATSLTNNFWLIVVSAILSGLSAGISLYTKTEKPEEKLLKHNDSARGYRELILRIEQQLILDIKDRNNANDFIREITSQMLELETGTESMPIITKKDLKKMDDLQDSSSEDNKDNKKRFRNFSITSNKETTQPSIEEKKMDIESQTNNECKLTNETLQQHEQQHNLQNQINETGLTHDKNKTFQLFFNKYPSTNKDLIDFQKKRFNDE